MKLTELQIRNARSTDGRPLKLADGHGLLSFVTPAGTKSWRYRYEVEGSEKLLTLGTHPAMGLAEARAARDQAREAKRAGRDPGIVKALSRLVVRQEAASTFEAVAREWHAINTPGWVARHAADVLHSLERDVFPAIGAVPIRDCARRKFWPCCAWSRAGGRRRRRGGSGCGGFGQCPSARRRASRFGCGSGG